MTLTPAADGGYTIAGTSLTLGGAPITIYNSPSAVETTGPGSEPGTPGNKPSPTVLSLTNDAYGAAVLVVDGRTSALPSAPLETDSSDPARNGNGNGYGTESISESTSGSGSGSGSGNIYGTGGPTNGSVRAASGTTDHKNTASHRFSRVSRAWSCCGVVITIMAVILL